MPNQTYLIGGKEITGCEFEIIKQAVQSLPRKLIAPNLGKSIKTLDAQMRLLYLKLHIKKIGELIIWALDNGFDRHGNYTPKKLTGITAQEILVNGNKQKGIVAKKKLRAKFKAKK